MINILIVGVGEIGSRYLQGLSKCENTLNIYVLDVKEESLVRAKKRWLEVTNKEIKHKVFYIDTINLIPKYIDVCIIATTSNIRPEIVKIISKFSSIKYWILEKVLAQSDSGLTEIQSNVKNSCRAWVNIPRRIMPWHQEIKFNLGLKKPISVKISGGSWGLACNSIHFLDLFEWWTDETIEEVCTNSLDFKWFKSKRVSNWEIHGTLHSKYSNGSIASFTSKPDNSDLNICISDNSLSWKIIESVGIAQRSDGYQIYGKLPFQSEITAKLIDQILTNGNCSLPTIENSIKMHRIYIKAMLKHWQIHSKETTQVVPIT